MMQDSNVPGESEQNEAWEYVCKRELIRPEINTAKLCIYVLLFVCLVVLGTLITSLFLHGFYLFFAFLGYGILGLMLFSKGVIIELVRLYQHYAPERIRRKCIFKPTCSEYMILALEKYGLLRGLYKGIYRMFFKCKGFYYSIDYP